MEMKKFITSYIFIQCIWCFPLFAKVDAASLLATSKSTGFIENKGQLIDQDRKPNSAVLYLLNGNGLNVQLKKTGFSYDIFTTQRKSKAVLGMAEPIQKLPGKEIEPEEVIYNFHRIDISLLGANPSPQIIAEGKSSDYTNYYNVDHAPDGILDVHQYQKVIVKNIYPNIDIEYLLNEKGFKYNFVVHAGAQLSDIKLQYKGAPFKIHRQELIFNTTQGEFIESIPASWLIKNGLNQTVQVDYTLLDKETIGFKTQAQIASFDLVVDPNPTRLWGTYYGGAGGGEYGYGTTADPSGNIYLVGMALSTNNISTSGSHQSSYGGTYDAFLVKFNTSGVRQWATYYGGSNYEEGKSVCSDMNGNIYLAGETASSNNISTTGSQQLSIAGNDDAFLVKFNTNGVRQWGTYYGGLAEDVGLSVATDASANVFVSGYTYSTSNIASSLVHQTVHAGMTDAFLVKFNTNGIRQWATYYGGSGEDRGASVAIDQTGSIYLGGWTNNASNISTTGSHQVNYGGDYDAFLIKFNTNGVRQWGTYFGGTNSDYGISVKTDGLNNIYLGGRTSSNFISTTGAHQQFQGGITDAFLVKFNTNGVRQWATYYGGANAEEPISITTDVGGNVYLTGWTQSINNISTPSAHQVNYGGGTTDAFLVKFNSNGVRQWGTYYGGSNDDWGYSIAADVNGNVFLAGYTSSGNNISTIGSHLSTKSGFNNAFLTKLFNCSVTGPLGSIDAINSSSSVFCQNTNYTFTLNSPTVNADGYKWMVPAGWMILSGQNTSSVLVRPSGSGIISVLAYNNCADSTISASLSIIVNSAPPPLGTIGAINNPSTTYCQNTAYTFSLSSTTANASGYWWTVPAGWVIVSGQTSTSLTVRPSGSGTLSVKAYNDCGDSTIAATRAITVTAAPAQPSAISTTSGQLINGIRTFCNGTSATFTVTNVSGLTYLWTFPSGWSGTGGNNSATRTVSLSNDTIRVVARNTAGCNSMESKLYARVFAVPATPSIIIGGNPACQGSANLFNVDSINYATTYTWTVPSGWSIIAGAGTPNLQVNAGVSSGNIGVTAGNFCGTSTQRVRSVSSVVMPLQPSVISGQTNICAGTNNLTYSVTAVSGVQYRWVLPANWQVVSGANTNQIIVNAPADANSGTIQVFPANASSALCEGPARTLNVNVVTFGAAGSISGNSNVCAGGTAIYISSGISGATSYQWILPAGWSGSASGNNISPNIGSSPGNFTIGVRGINGSCSSAVAQLPVTVYAQVAMPSSIIGNTSICGNSTQVYSTPLVANASRYAWTLPSGWNVDGATDSSVLNILSGNNSGILNLSVQAINLGCSSQLKTISVSTNPTPQIGSISGLSNTCEGATQTYSVSATNASSYTWTFPSGWSGSSSSNSIGLTFNGVADTLRVVAIGSSGCSSVQQKRFINVQAKPLQPVITGLTQGCSSQYETYRVNKLVNASSYTWTVPSGWDMSPSNGISTDTSILIRPTSGVGGNISVKATSSNGCVGSERILNISSISTSIPSTPLAITGDNAFCVGVSKTYSIAAVSGATGYTWIVPTGWNISSGQNTTSINVMPNTNTGTIQVQSIQGGCRSSYRSLSIFNSYTQASKPQSITPSSQPACELSSITLSSNTLIGSSSYVWELPSDWSFIGNSTLQSIQVQVGSSNGNVTVRGKNDGCTSDSSLSLGMTVSKLPQFLGGIAGEKYVKANTIRNYSIAASNANSYAWDIPSDWLLLGGENTNSITVLTGSQNATLLVNAINNCGSKQSSIDIITGVSAAIDEKFAFKNLDIFPVPATDNLYVAYEMQGNHPINYELFNINGQIILNGMLRNQKGIEAIGLFDLAAGIYFIQFKNEEIVYKTQKIQIIK